MTPPFGNARPLYRDNLHPRILCGPADIARLRTQVRRGDGLRLMNALRRKLRPVIERILNSPDLSKDLDFYGTNTWMGFGWTASMSMRDMALLAVIDDDEGAGEAARRCLLDPAKGTACGVGWTGTGIIAFDILHPRLSPEDRRQYVAKLEPIVHEGVTTGGRSFYKSAGGNTLVCGQVVRGVLAALAIQGEPGVADFAPALDRLLKALEASLFCAYNVDGFPEEDIGYGTDVAGGLAWAVEGVRRAGLYDVYDPVAGCPHWQRLGRALLHFVQPWGEYFSMTGDHPPCFWNREYCLARIAAQTRDPLVRWVLGAVEFTGKEWADNPHKDFHVELPLRKGFQVPVTGLSLLALDELKPGTHPAKANAPTAFRDRGRGMVSFRSGWSPDATFVVFDGSQRSPAAQGHFHASCGHFNLTALGEYFGIAPGRYGTEQDQQSLVLVDGKSGRSTNGQWVQTDWHGNLTGYQPGPFCDFASVDSSLQHDCMWARRHLGLVKGKGATPYVWTVEDLNKAHDFREFWWTLNTSPENRIELRHGDVASSGATGSPGSATITGWRKGNHLDVHFALPAPREYPRPHTLALAQDETTTSSWDYVKDPRGNVPNFVRPAAMVNAIVFLKPRLIAKVAGYNGRFMSLMLPRRKGEVPARVERLESVDCSLALRVTFEKVEDTIIWAYEHHLLEAGDVVARGRWCVVRRSRKTGRVLDHALGEGTRLNVAGKELKVGR
ncbi:MAG: hypothetical protein NTW19_18140 [Planctomycetota bacterium]|nr:hypothetical protein [Planctomycetota bacterium]